MEQCPQLEAQNKKGFVGRGGGGGGGGGNVVI